MHVCMHVRVCVCVCVCVYVCVCVMLSNLSFPLSSLIWVQFFKIRIYGCDSSNFPIS